MVKPASWDYVSTILWVLVIAFSLDDGPVSVNKSNKIRHTLMNTRLFPSIHSLRTGMTEMMCCLLLNAERVEEAGLNKKK